MLQIPEAVEGVEYDVEYVKQLLCIGLSADLKRGSLVESLRIAEELQKKNVPPLWIPKVPDFIKLERIPLLGSGKLDLQTINKLAREHGDKI